jgi:putative ABC transport system permease protein
MSAAFAGEVRQALARIARSPGFTCAAVLSLALAIGANVTVFTVIDRVLVNPLPYPESGRLITLDFAMPSRNISGFNSITSRMYFQFVERARTLSGVTAYRTEDRTLTGGGTPERVRVARTTPSLVPVLRVRPAIGRWFSNDEGAPGGAAAVVLSHGLWTRRYGADPAILGQALTVNGIAMTVIGVMPASFAFPDPDVQLWVPEPWSAATGADSYSYTGVARLQDGVTVDAARSELTTVVRALHAASPGNGYNLLVATGPSLQQATIGQVASALWTLLVAAAIVLLVACANIANLFLVRSDGRQREIGVRRALGAGRRSIAAYFFAESAWLSTAGGVIGFTLAWAGIRLLVAFAPATLPRLNEIALTPFSVAFTLILIVVSTLVFGAVPLVRLRSDDAPIQHAERGAAASHGRHFVRQVLVAGQIALALVLLVAAGLLLQSFQHLRAVDPGFDSSSTLTFQIGLPARDYSNRQRIVATHQAILDRLSALPGVTSASVTNCVPLSGRGFCGGAPLFLEGDGARPGAGRPIVAIRPVAGSFFETMGMRVLQGRTITRRDVEDNALVAVVNDTFVRVGLANQNPIGKRVRLGPHVAAGPDVWFTIIGVVATTPTISLGESTPAPKMYTPMFAGRDVWPALDVMTYVVRTTSSPLAIAPSARAAVAAVDSTLALAQVRTLQSFLDTAMAQRAFTMVLVAIASTTAVLLGLVGVYGVMSYIVSQRKAEIGVRLALGAEPRWITHMIVGQGGIVAVVGVIIGLTIAVAGGPAIASLLYRVSPHDPAVLTTTAIALMTAALMASWLAARRAASIDPVVMLRGE